MANIVKYVKTDVAKEIFPIPSGIKILETYGVIKNGKIYAEPISTIFITKFSLIDFVAFKIYPLFFNY